MSAQKKRLVVLTGAGISAESGLRTFRDSDGLWEGYDVADVATPGAWKKNPELVLRFYNERRRDVANAQPNEAHRILVALEKDFEVIIITQNIDDLHERAGSTQVVHLHGEIFKMRSERADHTEEAALHIRGDIQLGDTDAGGGQLRPHIVWFEEPVPTIGIAMALARTADVFAVVGTSLAVYPAAGLIDFVSYGTPVYVVDKIIPAISYSGKITAIEQPATLGMDTLRRHLLED